MMCEMVVEEKYFFISLSSSMDMESCSSISACVANGSWCSLGLGRF